MQLQKISGLRTLSDSELISRFQDVVVEERERLVLSLAYIAELDRRKLFFHYSSLRAYLVEEHGMEEWQAERRIRAARMLIRLPEIQRGLESGKLNLTLLELAQGVAYREKLSDSEQSDNLQAISGLSCRAAQRELATRYPQSMELARDQIKPLNGEYSEVRFVASEALLEKLEDLRGLLAHAHPQKMTMAELIDHLATDYRERHHPEDKARRAEVRQEKKKQTEGMQAPTAPRLEDGEEKQEKTQGEFPNNPPVHPVQAAHEMFTNSQNSTTQPIPTDPRFPSSPLIHELTQSSGGYQCSYVDETTRKRCTSRYRLEIDHVHAWSHGGKTELTNLRYLCANHHRRVSFLQFGESQKYFKSKRQ